MDEFAPWLSYLVIWMVSFAGLALLYFVRSRWAQLAGMIILYARLLIHISGGEWEIMVVAAP